MVHTVGNNSECAWLVLGVDKHASKPVTHRCGNSDDCCAIAFSLISLERRGERTADENILNVTQLETKRSPWTRFQWARAIRDTATHNSNSGPPALHAMTSRTLRDATLAITISSNWIQVKWQTNESDGCCCRCHLHPLNANNCENSRKVCICLMKWTGQRAQYYNINVAGAGSSPNATNGTNANWLAEVCIRSVCRESPTNPHTQKPKCSKIELQFRMHFRLLWKRRRQWEADDKNHSRFCIGISNLNLMLFEIALDAYC